MKHVHKTAIVPYSSRNMYELVNCIEEYPQCLPWCQSTAVLSRQTHEIVAKIQMGSIALGKAFTTRNKLVIDEQIEMQLVDGPFKRLHGKWQFHKLGELGCKVILTLDFEIANPVLSKVLTPIFTQIVNSLMDAFIKRASERFQNNT